jgi:hypothetical protein
MKSVITALSLLACASLCFAQASSQPPANPIPAAVSSLAPVVSTENLPDRILFTGGGIHNGQTTGFVNLVVHAAGPVYAAFAEDVQAGKVSTRAGIETIVFRHSLFALTAKGNAGVATSGTATGGSYGVGGSAILQLPGKLAGYALVFSGTWDYSNIADLGKDLATGKVTQVFSGGTYRFGIGKTF